MASGTGARTVSTRAWPDGSGVFELGVGDRELHRSARHRRDGPHLPRRAHLNLTGAWRSDVDDDADTLTAGAVSRIEQSPTMTSATPAPASCSTSLAMSKARTCRPDRTRRDHAAPVRPFAGSPRVALSRHRRVRRLPTLGPSLMSWSRQGPDGQQEPQPSLPPERSPRRVGDQHVGLPGSMARTIAWLTSSGGPERWSDPVARRPARSFCGTRA